MNLRFRKGQEVIHQHLDGRIDCYRLNQEQPIVYHVVHDTPHQADFTDVEYDPNRYADEKVMNTAHNPFSEKIKSNELVDFSEWKRQAHPEVRSAQRMAREDNELGPGSVNDYGPI
jgi:hypothetical protein